MTVRWMGAVMSAWLVAVTLTVSAVSAGQPQDLEKRAQSRTLSNGLTVVAIERPGAGSFAGILGCKAGTADDPPGGAGTAHLVEHYVAGPTQSLVAAPRSLKTDLEAEYEKTSGLDSARSKALESEMASWKGRQAWRIATTQDVVFYGMSDYQPRGLERFMEAQAQTMQVFPARPVAIEKEVLINEIEDKIARDIWNQRSNANLTTAYPNGHPYGAPVGGRVSDITTMTLASLQAFHRANYVPGRCMIAIVGDVSSRVVFDLAEKHLGGIRRSSQVREDPAPANLSGEQRKSVTSIAGPRLIISFRKPSSPSRDDVVADVVAALLGRGPESRLWRDLVAAKKLTADADAGNGGPGMRYESLLTIGAVPTAGGDPAELEAPLLAELEALKTEPVRPDELRGAVARLTAARETQFADDFSLALGIVRYQLGAGDWKAMLASRAGAASVTPEEIMAFARKYFTPEKRSVVVLLASPGEKDKEK